MRTLKPLTCCIRLAWAAGQPAPSSARRWLVLADSSAQAERFRRQTPNRARERRRNAVRVAACLLTFWLVFAYPGGSDALTRLGLRSLHERWRTTTARRGTDSCRLGRGVQADGWRTYPLLATSLYEDPSAEMHKDASARLREHPAPSVARSCAGPRHRAV